MTQTAPLRTATTDAIRKAADDILDRGYAVVKLTDLDARNLRTAISTAVEFFRRPLEDKMAHGSADHNYGYRPFGIEYSITPERPDMNECFTLWSSRLDLIPDAADIDDLTGSFLDWRDSLAPLVKAVLDLVAANFGTAAAPEFEKASYLQINYCLPAPAERDLLQDKHEDGHMVTVLHATAPGLEIYPYGFDNDEVLPVLPDTDEVVIMPGSVLTALSGGKISPLYHQVRNHGLDDRQSIMYFVNPEIEEPLFGWIDSADGTRADIREAVQNAPSMFGLPPVEAL
ncbi:2-oxoglutarate and iron-dependent oxygenase domain-containing protein [Jatrophihabitans endophyticus]|uniref:2-oxoglutarate and iron-dependent oxygenase domain-containing protein n=1 Tax=Jatrophihabitans endophyticus TaxID=1206085 RepID=UPI0019E18C3B|nr:2-oxoglutarate and iron-dependent oxygenase domain-containing protein [Jatrophihabitans endophyticus]MBE7187955.1 isopenicillin N synthase family oxygenase [Jatrophihabitans endophyticus]